MKNRSVLSICILIVFMLCLSSEAWAQFGHVWTHRNLSTGEYTIIGNSIGDATSDPLDVSDIMVDGRKGGTTAIGFNSINDSTDPTHQYIATVSSETFSEATGHRDVSNTGTTDLANTAEEYYILNSNGSNSSDKFRVRYDDGQIFLETYDHTTGLWTAMDGVTTYTYEEYAAIVGSNTTAKVESREEKAKISSRLTNQLISTRVMNVFSPRPKAKSKGGAKPKNTQKNAAINTGNVFASGYISSEGLSSGDDVYSELGIGVWGMGSYASTYVSKSGSRSENNIGVYMAGVDKLLLDDRLAVGVGFGYENSWSKLKTNGYTENGEGFSISPYAAYRVTDQFMVKAVFNSAFNHYDASGVSKNYDGTRLMGDISGEYSWIRDAWLFAAEAGFMYMNEDFNQNYTDVYLGEGRISGKLAYEFENGFQPYGRATFYQDMLSRSGGDFEDHTWEGALGLNYYDGPWSLSAEAFDAFNKDKNTYGGSLLVRFDF
ncbi:autotransporter outer membrane beta-barrel domain-containing protein [Maridesulfovibrio sp.]|uniref:autotransporter outer membrane beta-barrel domain-containing protein n=1 Tax=Maridesulfovibrio sp. TaxID=2795000 RepID=UPI0029CA95EC|nr:autotransporter outer membrane beta-barrel domain-containing protein [Maridesulfovibrio sp.]